MTGDAALVIAIMLSAVASVPVAVGQLVGVHRVRAEFRSRLEGVEAGLRGDDYAAVNEDELQLEFDSRSPLKGFPTPEAFLASGLVRRQICMDRLDELAVMARVTQLSLTTVSAVFLGVFAHPLGTRIWTNKLVSNGELLASFGAFLIAVGAMFALMLLTAMPMMASAFASSRRARVKYWRRAYRDMARKKPGS